MEASRPDSGPATAPATLTGAAADAVNHAMSGEQIDHSVRARVLRRLYADAHWLAFAVPPKADEDDIVATYHSVVRL